MIFADAVEDKHIEVLLSIADGFYHEIPKEELKSEVSNDFDESKLDLLCGRESRPSCNPEIREHLKNLLNRTNSESIKSFVIIMTILDSRVLSPVLTGSLKLVREMTIKEKEKLLIAWKDSKIEAKRRLFRSLHAICISSIVQFSGNLTYASMGHPGREVRNEILEKAEKNKFKYEMMEHPLVEGSVLEFPEIDVLIIGSGSGAGVVAQTLAENNLRALVLEKGGYFNTIDFVFDEKEGISKLYECGGALTTRSQEITILAGSTFGGGSTVNWSACIKTPFKVRKEWYDRFGVKWAADETFDDCIDYVWKKMGVRSEGINHSFSNQVILDGSKRLDYAARPVAQNVGGKDGHDCGLCFLGCTAGTKQGSASCWFQEPSRKGSLFMEKVQVNQILRSNSNPYGVECKSLKSGKTFIIKGPRKIVVSAGTLNTPIILQRSGFKNRHIGANLKLHPVSVLHGDFGKESNMRPFSKPILTSVCTEVDDLDGKAHGAKVETILSTPYLNAVLFPWSGSDQLRKDLSHYNHLATMISITRDTSSGKIWEDPNCAGKSIIDYAVNKFDREAILKGLLITADILYIEGARSIIPHQVGVPRFQSSKPKEERSVHDEDYTKWKKQVARIPLKKYKTLFGSAHQMSSCRISGKGQSDGACDLRGRLYECKDIYVADASSMPTASGANPMITTMAVARLISLGLINDLKPKANL